MKLYDITLPISDDMPVWPGDPAVMLTRTMSILGGAPCNVTGICMGAHTGTHVDAPYHFFENGMTTDSITLERLIGPCLVVDLSTEATIGRKELRKHDLSSYIRILIKTRNSELWAKNIKSFSPDFIAVGLDAAEYLLELQCCLIGVDYLSIEAFGSKKSPVHKLLLQNNVVIIEGLNLSETEPGGYELICLPMSLQGCDGAPARVVLRGE